MDHQNYSRCILIIVLLGFYCSASPIPSSSEPTWISKPSHSSSVDYWQMICAIYVDDCQDLDRAILQGDLTKQKRLSSSLFHGIPKFGKRAFSSAFAGIPKFG